MSSMQFLRGNAQAPKGHALLVAKGTTNSQQVFCTYCIVPPIPMSLAKFISPLLAAQLPAEELREGSNIAGIPIPPMLEEVESMEFIERLAEHRGDDVCLIGTVTGRDENARLNLALFGSQEYAQLYATYVASANFQAPIPLEEPAIMSEVDTEELLLQSMSDRQKLTELGKLTGMVRYALEGRDTGFVKDTQNKMQRIVQLLADKYRGNELITAALEPQERGTRLAELYLSRAFKLLDEEYADIPGIEREIRELKEQ